MTGPSWITVIYRVTSMHRQQRILQHFRGVPGLTALGTSSDGDHFVVLDCERQMLKRSAQELIEELDPGSIQTFATQAQRQLDSSG